MKEEIEFYINENGIACVPLKMYNDSLEEIERLNNELEKQNIDYGLEIERLNNIINDLHNGLEKIIEQGYDYNEKDKIAIELISKIEI